MTEQTTGIKKTQGKGPITIDTVLGIHTTDYQKKGTVSVGLRQKVETVSEYPGIRPSSDLQDNLFSAEAFANVEGEKYVSTENRIAFLSIPSGSTVEQVQKMVDIANSNGATIYRILSNDVILDSNQKSAIAAGLRKKEDFAKTQAMRYPTNEKTIADGTANKLILDKSSRIQYRRTFFSSVPKEDIDQRFAPDVEGYASPELIQEMVGAALMQGQTI